ncbi:ABC transporter substrate-binding protein [Achromatium sp. WMS1]|nr:ABC transporter substrate-binding protein [Achromatium sp. WMS1]
MIMQYMIRLIALSILCLPITTFGTLKIVATSSSTGMLVRELTAGQAQLTILAPPDRDLHYIQARPSMIRALRRADLLVALGADLEIGWLPVAIRQAANPQILPGRLGYFEVATQVSLLDVGNPADRALGDVHPVGNPHINMDPVRMAQAGLALAQLLARLDPSHAQHYHNRAMEFKNKVQARLLTWQRQVAKAPGVITFHRDSIYLLNRLNIPLLGTIELVPGVPPTASHLHQLIDSLRGRKGAILITTFQPERGPKVVASTLNWPLKILPLEPPLNSDGDIYLAHIDRWVAALNP